MSRYSYYAIYKPFNYLSQFTQEVPGQHTLKDLYDFPDDVYPVGRLDKNSEGLLILTNDKSLTAELLEPSAGKFKTYLAQVEGQPVEQDLEPLLRGIEIRIKKRQFTTQPAQARIIDIPKVQERNPPIRYRKHVPDSWLELSISEGKFHQVRKMCAAVGFPVLRLIRIKVGKYQLPTMEIGCVREIPSRSDII